MKFCHYLEDKMKLFYELHNGTKRGGWDKLPGHEFGPRSKRQKMAVVITHSEPQTF